MTKFRLGLVQRIWEEATVFVEAATPEEAKAKANEKVNKGEVEWRFLEANDDFEITSVDEC